VASLQTQLTALKVSGASVTITRIGAVPVMGKVIDDGSTGDSIIVQHESGMNNNTFVSAKTLIPKAAIAGVGV
jgi:hypothetical protein